MTAPAQIIQGLPPLSWRGMEWPFIESAPVHFSHTQAERRYPYIDAAGHDNTGRDPLKPTVRFFFLETLQKGAFTKDWPKWRKAFFDGSAGDFRHPLLGTFRARVEDGDITFAAQQTAGITVDVRFTETIDNVDKPNKLVEPYPSGIAAAKAASASASAYGITWPSGLGSTSLENSMASLFSGSFTTQTSIDSFAAKIAGNIESMIVQAELLTDPKSYAAYDNLLLTWDIAKRASATLARDLRSTGKKITQNDTTIAAFAADVRNTEDEIMQLNLALLRSPIVPSGTAVTYYTGK